MNTYHMWYMRSSWFGIGLFDKGKPDPTDLEKTHILLRSITSHEERSLESIFVEMQAEYWDGGEDLDNILLLDKGLSHTSMVVGDVIVANDIAYLVRPVGFERLGRTDNTVKAPPQQIWSRIILDLLDEGPRRATVEVSTDQPSGVAMFSVFIDEGNGNGACLLALPLNELTALAARLNAMRT